MPEQPFRRSMSRRAFLRTAGAAGIVAAGAGVAGIGNVLGARPPRPVTRNPLYLPPTVAPSNLSLRAAAGTVGLGGGKSGTAWVYNGSLPGPTIVARRNDQARITLDNGLSQETIIHWHGFVVNHENDGHPMYAAAPGASYAYDFPIVQRATMNWYHPHPHMLTGEQVAMGLAGAFIVRDADEDALGLPSGDHELPLVIRDAKLSRTNDLEYTPKGGGFTGNVALVNGTLDAGVEVDTGLYRLRVLNGSNARIYRLALSTGAAFTLIGNDGGLLPSAVALTELDLAPAERVDLLVDLRGAAVGDRVMLRDLRAGWDLLELAVARRVTGSWTVPASLSTVTPLSGPILTRTFSFDGMSRINGRSYEMDRIDFQIPLGQVERWRFTTNGNAPHPVHVHGAYFQVEARSGGRGRVFPWEAGWKDTVLLEDGETVDVLVRFDAYRGVYLMHCHKLEHEDMGMMLNFEVI